MVLSIVYVLVNKDEKTSVFINLKLELFPCLRPSVSVWAKLSCNNDWATSLSLFTFMHWRRKWQPTLVFLPGESQGQGSLGGLPSMGSHRVGHDWSDLATAAATDNAQILAIPQNKALNITYIMCKLLPWFLL